MTPWVQVYDPFGNPVLSTLAAVVPIALLLILIASGKVKAHWAALIALAVGIAVSVFAFTMPAGMALRAASLNEAVARAGESTTGSLGVTTPRWGDRDTRSGRSVATTNSTAMLIVAAWAKTSQSLRIEGSKPGWIVACGLGRRPILQTGSWPRFSTRS